MKRVSQKDKESGGSRKSIDIIEDLGVYFITGSIDSDLVEPICRDLLYKKYSKSFEADKITFIINSEGGSVEDVFSLLDIVNFTRFKLETVATGCAFSAAFFLLISGTKGMRKMTADTLLMSHNFRWGNEGEKYPELLSRRPAEDFINKRIEKLYVRATGMPLSKVKKTLLLDTDVWLSPQEAKKFNVIDHIIGR